MVQRRWLVLGVVIAGACARGHGDGVPDGGPGDGAPGVDAEVDAAADAMVDAPPAGPAVPLLLTEVVLSPSSNQFIEILNPTDQAVSLYGYYLADHGAYFRVPAGAPFVDAGDFVVRFPAGAVIGPRAVVTVAVATAATFESMYGAAPTFSIASGTMVTVTSNGVSALASGGELIALFYWNGQDDLVGDVDLLLAGVPGAGNGLIDKSDVALDGPDAGTTTSTYKADARTMAPQATAPAPARSTKRISPEAGFETQDGTGNGLDGDDETSENILSTWDSAFTPPTPGTVPPELMP